MNIDKQQKADFVLKSLKNHYPVVKCALNHKSAFQLLVATILSAQCTDVRVNIVTPELFRHYPTLDKMAVADIEHLKELVRTTGFYNNKSKNILGAAQMIVAEFGGVVPDNMQDLLKLPGVARKTANVVLSEWYGKNEGFVVDTHVKRLSNLLGLTNESNPVKIEKDLVKLFPQEEWGYMSLALIQYGRDFCTARKHEQSQCFLGHYS